MRAELRVVSRVNDGSTTDASIAIDASAAQPGLIRRTWLIAFICNCKRIEQE